MENTATTNTNLEVNNGEKLSIKKILFRQTGNKVEISKKVVLHKVEEGVYLANEYYWSRRDSAWYPFYGTAFFNGIEPRVTGRVRICTTIPVERYFELLVKYEEFMYMDESENDTDATYELGIINEHLNNL